VNSARSFVVSTLERWRAPLVIGDAVHLVEEMVASAVRTTGVADPNVQWRTLTHLELLTVTLVGLRNSIGMEVWDNAPSWPAQPVNEPALDRELLEVLKTAAGQWGIMPSGRGRVVWAKPPSTRALKVGFRYGRASRHPVHGKLRHFPRLRISNYSSESARGWNSCSRDNPSWYLMRGVHAFHCRLLEDFPKIPVGVYTLTVFLICKILHGRA
jgi:hypothetical protein